MKLDDGRSVVFVARGSSFAEAVEVAERYASIAFPWAVAGRVLGEV